ncbi:MAG: hypothetical protein M1839_000621 [Geoglossum umbratile]|nr:MAG: hypothetical protein M1839_000621 [Geoglossum umbratile]
MPRHCLKTRLLPAGTFIKDTLTWKQKGRHMPPSVDKMGATGIGCEAVQSQLCGSAIATADRRFTYEVTRYEMRMELYRASANYIDGNDPGNPADFLERLGENDDGLHPEESEDDLDDDPNDPDDGLYAEWSSQLKADGINEKDMA